MSFPPFVLLAVLLSVPAVAAPESTYLEELPPVQLQRLPPRTSWEFGVQASYGTISRWRVEVPPWVGLGVRGGAGRHSGLDRLGAAVGLVVEGEVPLHFNVVVEPQLTWDRVQKGLQVGASVGPSVLLHSKLQQVDFDMSVAVAPSAAVRVGWSQPWTRVGRRFFVVAEPRMRWAHGHPNPTLMVWLGSGSGR